jgi:hypothetical protein
VANMPDGVKGQERWYGYSLSLGSDWNLSQIVNNRQYFFFGPGFRYTQTSVNGPGSALEADRIDAVPTFYTGSNLSNTVGATTAGRFKVGSVFTNRWMDFVYHIKWSTGSDGFREVWRDGVKVGRYDGPTLGTSSAFELRTGIYQGTAVNHTRTMYVDNHRVGTSYAAVDPAR